MSVSLSMQRFNRDNAVGHVLDSKRQTSDSEERLMGIIGAATDAIITVDAEQKVTLFNAAAESMFLCPAADAVGQPLDKFIPHRFREIHGEHIRVFGETGVTTRAMASQRSLMALRADGVEFPVEATISQIVIAGQRLFTAIVRDISERRRAEEALRASEERYRALFEYAPDGILIADPQSRYIDANPSMCRMLSYTREELIGLHASDIVSPSEVQHIEPALGIIQANSDYNREWQLRRKDGSIFAAEVIATKMPDGSLVGMIRDVTERKEAKAALRESEGRLWSIVETAVDGIITIDEKGSITSFNPAAMRLFGYTPDEVAGKNINQLMPEPYHREHDGYLRNYLTTGTKKIIGIGREVIGKRKDGTEFPMELAVSETRLGDRRIFTGIVRDISERKRSEQALAAQTEELARSNVELERFAYVASHDLQEPMRTVRSFAQMLQRRCGETLKGDGEEYLGFITQGVQRMQTLISDLLAYSRVGSQGAAFGSADIKEILAKVLDNLQASIQSQQATVTNDELPVVLGDATQLGQVFQNLLANALKFHGNRPPQIHISVRPEDGAWIFSVKDNGIGIDSQYFERIFVIFQRLHTIEEYGGTGIGLAICKKIVERHGGRIWVESKLGEGSSFHFSIPRRAKSV